MVLKREHGRVRIIGLLDEAAVMEVNNCVCHLGIHSFPVREDEEITLTLKGG
jgi:hypothetical protein